MPRFSQTYLKLHEIVEESAEFQRYFGLIKLLEKRKRQAENELQIQKVKLEQTKDNVQQSKELIVKIELLHRKVFGLSKEKIQVCKQFEDCIYKLKCQLAVLLNDSKESKLKRKKNAMNQDNLQDPSIKLVSKYKIKQDKIANLIDKLENKREKSVQRETSLGADETNTEKYDLRKVRKIRQI